MLNVRLTEVADGLDICNRKRKESNITQAFELMNWCMVPVTKMKNTRSKAGMAYRVK